MTTVRLLMDECVPSQLESAVRRLDQDVDLLRVGQPGAPPLATQDPEVLEFLETSGRLLVTMDRRTMRDHLVEHFLTGRHTWGVVIVNPRARVERIAQELALIVGASTAEEWQDQTVDLPLWPDLPA